MKNKLSAKEHYQRLRVLSCEVLWIKEVVAFDQATPQERVERVAVVRAVGVVFSESGTEDQKEQARKWMRQLLHDSDEKVRRYAMAALPKLGANDNEEMELLGLLEKVPSDREQKFLCRTLQKIGGSATLVATEEGRLGSTCRLKQKVSANIARRETPSIVVLDRSLASADNLRIHLRCRIGLERILEDELHEQNLADKKFRFVHSAPGMVIVTPVGDFQLADIYALRCFGAASIVLGFVNLTKDNEMETLAQMIVSPDSRRVFLAFTKGPIRYRLEFVSRGHQRGAVRSLANRIYQLCPELLNDSRDAPWQINIYHAGLQISAELTPRLRPDPRFAYRRKDVPAASHPPLAACMARLAEKMEGEIVWDPFCGSGVELVECALRGGVRQIFGTDCHPDAITAAKTNFAAALGEAIPAVFDCCDFRHHSTAAGLNACSVSLVISNPPMGRRVPIANLRRLIEDLFMVAGEVLRPGGRLIFANPLSVKPGNRSLDLKFRQKVDLGGFNVHVEKYVKR